MTRLFTLLATAGSMALAAPVAISAPGDIGTSLPRPERRCDTASMAVALPAGVQLTQVAPVSVGPVPVSSQTPNGAADRNDTQLGAHCLVQGAFEQRLGVNNERYAIRFELRVPDAWNGRLLYQGGGGLNGIVLPAIGSNVSNGSTAPVALARGFAVVSTDSGHEGQDAAFADDQIAKANFAYAAIGKVTRLAQTMVTQIGGAMPARTYFAGCSNGGREAMIAAQRHAELFDGVVAGDPAFRISDASILANFSQRKYRQIAPFGADGEPVLARALSDTDVSVLSRGVLAQCDALDGARDGMIFDHRSCRFDPAVLTCRPGQEAGCLSPAKISAITAAFAGPRTAGGEPLVSSWVYDAGVAGRNWREWQTGVVRPDGTINGTYPALISNSLARYLHYPAVSPESVNSRDPAAMLQAITPTAQLTDADWTQMTSFAAKGGKMLLVTGWSDPIFTPLQLIDWYEKLDATMRESTGRPAFDMARLFLVPGMNHCGGGPALDNFDALSTLVDWVEQGRAPRSMAAMGTAFPGLSRPICAYPTHAVYTGRGDISDASRYACR